MRAKKSFTLIELFLVIALIGIVSASFQWGVLPLLRTYSFKREAGQLKDGVALVQELMIDTRMDLRLSFLHEEGEIRLELHSSQPLAPKVKEPIEQLRCRNVTAMYWNGKEEQSISLDFEGHLCVIDSGEMMLQGRHGVKERITFRDFPGRFS